MAVKYGVFLARMQPVHNAHLYMINKALQESDMVLVVLGSENKVDMIRNPYDVELRKQMLRECFDEEQNSRIKIATLPDWSTESDIENTKIWGRYFYYNVVSRIGQKRFSLYYSDNPQILDSWFLDTEVYSFIRYRNFERNCIFEGLSSTKIRKAFMERDLAYIIRYCPQSVVNRFEYLSSYYKEVTEDPKEDFSME